MLSIYYIVTTSGKEKKSKIEVSTDSMLPLNTGDQVQ